MRTVARVASRPAAIGRLQRCKWEGNARELENLIERALALSDGAEIGVADLPIERDEDAASVSDATSLVQDALDRHLKLADLEDLYINRVLAHTGGNKVHAARILGINRRTLYRRGERSCARAEQQLATNPGPEEAR